MFFQYTDITRAIEDVMDFIRETSDPQKWDLTLKREAARVFAMIFTEDIKHHLATYKFPKRKRDFYFPRGAYSPKILVRPLEKTGRLRSALLQPTLTKRIPEYGIYLLRDTMITRPIVITARRVRFLRFRIRKQGPTIFAKRTIRKRIPFIIKARNWIPEEAAKTRGFIERIILKRIFEEARRWFRG